MVKQMHVVVRCDNEVLYSYMRGLIYLFGDTRRLPTLSVRCCTILRSLAAARCLIEGGFISAVVCVTRNAVNVPFHRYRASPAGVAYADTLGQCGQCADVQVAARWRMTDGTCYVSVQPRFVRSQKLLKCRRLVSRCGRGGAG